MHWGDISSALLLAGVNNVIVESYGMKGTLWAYNWLWEEETVAQTSRQTYIDLAGYVTVESNPTDIILLKITHQPEHYGRFRVYGMCNDIATRNDFAVGSVSFKCANEVERSGSVMDSARLYSPLIHTIKHYAALSLLEMPTTFKQIRHRICNIDSFITKLDAGEVDMGRTCGRLRVEVRLSISHGATQADTLQAARQHLRWLLQHVQPVTVPVQQYRRSIAEYRTAASNLQ